MHDPHFESRKNWQATSYTVLVLGLMLLFFILWRWPLQQWYPPMAEEGMEVNLGNSDFGSGEDQPLEPGSPAPAEQNAYTPPKTTVAPVEPAKDFVTDDKDEEAPVIKKPPVVKKESIKVPEKTSPKPVTPKKTVTEAPPVPPAPKPKAVFKGVNGTGTGGNEADSYKKGGNEGIAGGNGDQGRPGGDPDAKNYTGGGSGRSGISISRGLQGRRITGVPSFEDDFNENAKIAVDIKVDAGGTVLDASFQPRGSTTSDPSLRAIALRKARQIKFNGGEESSGTIIFNFRIKN